MIGSRSHTYSTAEHDRRIALGLAEPTGRPTASACSTCGARLWDRPETTNGSCAACTTSAEKHDAVEAARADERREVLQRLIDYIDRNAAQYERADVHSWAGGCAIVFAEMKQAIERVRNGGEP